MYSKRACLLADKSGTSKQKADAYYYMARNMIFMGKYKESYAFIKKGRNEEAVRNNSFLMALFTELTSIYYSRLYMIPQEMKENKAALKLVDPNKNAESKLFVSRIYMWIADCYTENQKYDSAHFYINKSIQLAEEIPEKQYLSFNRMFRRKAYSYFYKAQIYNREHKEKQALPFIEKSYIQAIKENHTYIYPILEAYGDYYFLSKQYKNAISYYKNAIENKKKYLYSSSDINLKISQCYNKIGDISNEKKYLKISSEQRRFDEKVTRQDIVRIAEGLLNEEIEKTNAARNKNILIYTSTLLLSLLLLAYIIHKLRKKKNKIIESKNDLLEKTKYDLTVKEKTITTLQEKVNDSVSELILMVKNNSPEFWNRFQMIFPDFTGKMLKINPKFRTSELVLSAYLYLGFTTKEISQYTFKSVKTIENNRYNFRKKINISSEEDLSLWIKEYIKNAEIK
ncbi:tetratricopeptide repeat protein [Chryseobacterium sp. StRB126]|uniref:tetratricopeptide repeat protein n=1 Tax=Chryseobacterium sp. StRB126 TaxID=878220 RepID=UPI00118751CE|nr:tetratricopeptide repeat protein [Chryseobacterium sp. StRB126]